MGAFIARCQTELCHELSALGAALNQLLDPEEVSEIGNVTSAAADASKIFCDVDPLLPIHQRYKVNPGVQNNAGDYYVDTLLFRCFQKGMESLLQQRTF